MYIQVALTAIGVTVYPSVQQAVLMTQSGLIPQHVYTIHMKYTGVINDVEDDGLFMSRYTTSEGVHKYITPSV